MGLSSGCIPHTAFQDEKSDASTHLTTEQPRCIESSSERPTGTTIQRIERTICEGDLSLEVSSFDPPLEKTLSRNIVKILGKEHVLLYFDPDVIVIGTEITSGRLSPGDSLDVSGYSVVIESIDGGSVRLSIKNPEGGTLEAGIMSNDHYGWYAFYAGSQEIDLKLYGLFCAEQGQPWAELAAFYKPSVIYQRQQLTGQGAVFVLETHVEGDLLTGWTLAKNDQ